MVNVHVHNYTYVFFFIGPCTSKYIFNIFFYRYFFCALCVCVRKKTKEILVMIKTIIGAALSLSVATIGAGVLAIPATF